VSNLSTGEMLTILGQAQKGYCKVKVQETGEVGYISVANMQNILNGTNDSFTQLSENGQVVNVSSNVRIRSNPAIGNNIIGYLTNGTTLNILGKQGQWYKVSVNGQIGFIYEEYVSTSITNSNSQSTTNNVNTNLENTTTSITNKNSNRTNSTSSINSSKNTKNIIVKTNSSVVPNSSSNVNKINNNTIKDNIVYTNPQQITFIQKTSTLASPDLQVNKKKDIKLKVLEKLYGTDPGTQNTKPIWYKVETQNGLIGYIAQNETYYKIVYTNPNKNIPIFEAPNTSTLIIDSINHKKEPLYVISNIKTTNPMNHMKTQYYKVCTINGKIGFVPCSYI
ncbi:SH3 domain-containing protein, partial [uncultured Tyzzerella sp.]